MLVGHGDRRFPGEGRHAGDHLVEDAARRVQVRAGIHGLAAGLLRAQVLGGAENGGGGGEAGCGIADGAGDAEVHHLHRTVAGDHDVRRLDVAVDDALLVGKIQGSAHICHHAEGPVDLHRAVHFDDVTQGVTLDDFHDDVRQRTLGRGFFALVVDRDDRRMIEGRRVLGFASEPLVEGLVPGKLGPHDLDGHVTTEDRVTAPVDFRHAAVSEGVAEFVASGED